VAVSVGVNRSFQTFFEDFRKLRISPKRPPLRALEPKLRLRGSAVGRCSGYEHFVRKSRTYVLVSRSDLPAPEREAAIYEGAGSESIGVFEKLSKSPAADWTPLARIPAPLAFRGIWAKKARGELR
jgi:hypothetical protein